MKKNALARFITFSALYAMLCVLAVSLAVGCWQTAQVGVANPGSLYIDGSDFTPLLELGSLAVNGMLLLFAVGSSFVVMTFVSALFLVPFRFIAVRKDSAFTRREVLGTLTTIVAGVVLSAAAAAILGGTECVAFALLLVIPQVLIGTLLYWLCIFLRYRKQ